MPLFHVRIGLSEMVYSEGYLTIEAPDEATALEMARDYQDEVQLYQTGSGGREFDKPQIAPPDLCYPQDCLQNDEEDEDEDSDEDRT